MKFEAAVFDLDGTLLNSLEDLADCMNLALTSQGFPAHPVAAYKFFVGDGMDILARRVLPAAAVNEERINECVLRMRANYETRWKAKSKPYDGIPELLDGLVARGVKIAVLSNKPDDFTKLIVRELFGQWSWAVVFGSRAGVPKKPDPAGALELAKELSVAPDQSIYFGDTNTDMRTARAAGMFAVGCAWGFRPASELTEAGAQALIDHPSQGLHLL